MPVINHLNNSLFGLFSDPEINPLEKKERGSSCRQQHVMMSISRLSHGRVMEWVRGMGADMRTFAGRLKWEIRSKILVEFE